MKKEQKERKAALAKAATQEKGTTKSAIGEAFWSWDRLVPVLFFPTFDEFKIHTLNDAIDFARPFIIQNFTEMAGVVNTKDAKTAQSTFRCSSPLRQQPRRARRHSARRRRRWERWWAP